MSTMEVNFDGLIGPTHNFAGLALGNTASNRHRFEVSRPKEAALEGLKKMKLIHSMGIPQGLIPPQVRPDMETLRQHGYQGSLEEILKKASEENQELFLQCCSASSMWTANAATVSPSSDTKDGKVHITPANLRTNLHRQLEVPATHKFLKQIFQAKDFIVHDPLSGDENFFDEGAANHMRFTTDYAAAGLHVFVYGNKDNTGTRKFPVRQTLQASRKVAETHLLKEKQILFVEQNPRAIEAGVFHNDVIAVSNQEVFIYHEKAFVDTRQSVKKIEEAFQNMHKKGLCLIEITESELSLKEAVDSYLFNSQIITADNGVTVMIAPLESREGKASFCIDRILNGKNPVSEVRFVPLEQSMKNGGGPACLRLRVVLTQEQLAMIPKGFLLDDEKFEGIENWIHKHYRDELHIKDLSDIRLFEESYHALHELESLLGLKDIYSHELRTS